METLVIATKNMGKAREYRQLFSPFGITVKTLADFPDFIMRMGKRLKKMPSLKRRRRLTTSTYRSLLMIPA